MHGKRTRKTLRAKKKGKKKIHAPVKKVMHKQWAKKKSSMQAENLLSLHPPPPPLLLFLIVRSFKGVFFGYYPRIEAKGIVGMDSTLPLLRPFETSSDFSNSRMNGNHFTRNTEIGGSFWQKLLGTSYRTSQLPKQNP